MERNARDPKHLRDREGRGEPAGEMPAPPPFTLTPLGPDPGLGWAGWGAGAMAGWAAAQAERMRRGGEDGEARGAGRGSDEPR
jgi:hypothetical protein